MMQIRPRKAGLISVVLALLIITVFYAAVGTVDLVFKQNGREVSRQENVSMISDITLPEGNLTYTADGETKEIGYVTDLKAEIGVTVLKNFINFKWQERDNVIVITQE